MPNQDEVREIEFTECDTCRAKPGSPVLCRGCVLNRMAIERLKSGFDSLLAKKKGEIEKLMVGGSNEFERGYKQAKMDVLSILTN